MRKFLTYFLLTTSFYLLGSSSCQKKEIFDIMPHSSNIVKEPLLKKRFFNSERVVSLELRSVMQKIKRQDSMHNFIDAFSSRYGFPIWDSVISNEIIQSGTDQSISNVNDNLDTLIFFIPFRTERSKRINSFLAW